MRKTLVLMLIGCAAALDLSGCIVAPAYPPGYDAEAGSPPPQQQAEVVGVAPYPGWFWIGGYWGWAGGRYVWNGGHWEAPRPGYTWVPHTWVHAGGVWRARAGHWEGR